MTTTPSNGLYLLLGIGCVGAIILGAAFIAIILAVRAGRKRRPAGPGAPPAGQPSPAQPVPAPARAQRYCPHCGQAIKPEARFCEHCGQPLVEAPPTAQPVAQRQPPQRQPPQRQPPPQGAAAYAPAQPPYQPAQQPPGMHQTGEPIVGVLTGLRRSAGLLKSDAYNLVVTPSRLIFAQVTNDLMKAMVEEARLDAKAQGKGFFGQWGAQMGAHNVLVQRYYELGPDAIPQTYPDSFVVPAVQVQRVRVRHGSMDNDGSSTPDRIVIQAASGKMTFQLSGGSNAGQAKKLLRQVLGDRAR